RFSRTLFNLVLLEVSFVLESGCKGSTFSVITKTFLHKILIFRRILTVIHINTMFYCVRAQSTHTIGLYSTSLTKCHYFPYYIRQNAYLEEKECLNKKNAASKTLLSRLQRSFI
ncbi:hypothetical protein, partial [Prevotella sp.]|uniref:hypothetical protein n=1 Tax=Prevotella sp. TaxID=59823 RepID=UPI00307B8CD2